MNDPALVRAACLFGPAIATAVAAGLRPPARRTLAAAIVATAWNAVWLPALNLLAVRAGWWTFHAEGGTAAGIPVDLLIGWSVLWGALPVLADGGRIRLPLLVAGLAWLDLAVMPFAAPVVRLGADWLVGEAAAVAAALVPGLLLARWTRRATHLALRAGAQMLLSAVLMFALPIALVRPHIPGGTAGLAITVQLLAVPLLLGVIAVREFAERGGGTPLPYDPPQRLVTSGPYAYVRNPMQLSVTLSYALLSLIALDWRLLAAAATSFAYGAGLADWHEAAGLRDAHGERWAAYRAGVRAWLPRLRPWSGTATARLYVAESCGPCSRFGRWVARRHPVALELVPAEHHPRPLRRMTYETDDGAVRAEGVAALARMLGHLHLGWAVLGWLLVVPGVRWFAQLCVDALGAGPRDIPHRPQAQPPAATTH
ncbi:methyltransferase [Streptomyces halobius]|uniref:Isoprenylcysteine carboxylmethyltransferase family protein n=1 Tax=Streptomyces halobius TaxID=2879846 RepID=A0ABY4MLU3_9ACTN|nr:methyltransferase [Streptomyces halobius]UQA97405.1 isoprenylcysteine carboxylmethyltransferase family protein [Streptomyces halobius]